MLRIKHNYTVECHFAGQLMPSKVSEEDSDPNNHKIEDFECFLIGQRDSTEEVPSFIHVKKNYNLIT